MNLIELQNKIHAQNVEMGWWDEERDFDTFVCLFHSELSEAMEGEEGFCVDALVLHKQLNSKERFDKWLKSKIRN